MSDQESNRIRRIVGWGIVGLIVVIGLSIAISLLLFCTLAARRRLRLSILLLLPISFWLARCYLLDIHSLLGSKMVFLALERRKRRILLVPAPAKTGRGVNCQRYAKGEITREQFEQMMRDLRQGAAEGLSRRNQDRFSLSFCMAVSSMCIISQRCPSIS
jgi:uncharacterized membrane protein